MIPGTPRNPMTQIFIPDPPERLSSALAPTGDPAIESS